MHLFHKITTLITTYTIIFLMYSCSDNIAAEIPSYIEIDYFDYEGNSNQTPPYPNSHESVKITDAWVTMDGQIIGNYEIPCKIPILSNGEHSFNISPGIKANGIAGTRIQYPFYEKYQTDVVLDINESVYISPKTTYKTDPNDPTTPRFKFKETGTFEEPGTMFEASTTSDTNVVIQNEIVFQGEYSAAIYLDSINTYFDVQTSTELDSLIFNTHTFLELDFKSNINFNVGLVIINDIAEKQELIQLYATDEWKKIYLDLKPLTNMGNSTSKFKIYFEGFHNGKEIESNVYLDNLKLVFSK
ncbi:MAG: hypothetical protein CMD23_05430 [Flavobacteriales bacterium]|nr:hypothetical protein [Flavobacteriales bacterium]